jgi:hypothetical protein
VWVLGSAAVHWGALRGREIILGMDRSICPFVKKTALRPFVLKDFAVNLGLGVLVVGHAVRHSRALRRGSGCDTSECASAFTWLTEVNTHRGS